MAQSLTNKKVSQTYLKLLQVQQNKIYDGVGNQIGYLNIKDNNVAVSSLNFNTINFIGNELSIYKDTINTKQANIYLPKVVFVSHFNTSDGSTTPIISGISTTNRSISKPTTQGNPFNVGNWDVDNYLFKTTNTQTISYSVNDYFLIEDLTDSYLNVSVLDPVGNVLAFNAVLLNSTKSVVDQNITINISNFEAQYGMYKGVFNTSINLNNILPQGGRFSIAIGYSNLLTGNSYEYYDLNVFYDSNNQLISMPSILCTISSQSVKYISGVSYMDALSQYVLSIPNIYNMNMHSFNASNLMTINSTNIGVTNQILSYTSFSNWDNLFNNTSSLSKTIIINRSNYYVKSFSQSVSLTINDWNDDPVFYSNTIPVIIDTFTDNSTRIYQDFRNQSYRLKTLNLEGFTSSIVLGNEQLQIQNSKLVYPRYDYTTYAGNQPNYSNYSGSRSYVRKMWHQNVAHSNGLFLFSAHNITQINLNNDQVVINISLDGVDWYNLNELYTGGVLINGSGCRINNDTYNLTLNGYIQFTLGTGKYTSADSNWGIYIKIEYKQQSIDKYIGSYQITNWV